MVKAGEKLRMSRWTKTPEQRLWQKVNKNGPTPEHRLSLGKCWLWLGSQNGKGYGKFYANGKKQYVHRFSYSLKKEIPQGYVIDHICRNRSCIRPSHLRAITNMKNLLAKDSNIWNNGQNMRDKTHCPKGHEYTKENTRMVKTRGRKNPYRSCKLCRKINDKNRRERQQQGED